MKIGRRLAIKLLNASKFVLTRSDEAGAVTHAVDRGMLTQLAALVDDATSSLEAYEYTRALDRAESFFWGFCDDYLELVKARHYGEQGDAAASSANGAMRAALSVLVRLFAPFLPFCAEEVWSWWQKGSIHRAPWPSPDEIAALCPRDEEAAGVLAAATDLLGAIRRAKSEARRPLKATISHARVRDTAERIAALERARADVCAAGSIESIALEVGESLAVEVTFAEA
jgi:valyl-tRNA synthetase